MANYIIPNIKQALDGALNTGTYILLLHANAIPPHLELLVDGGLYAISVKGPKLKSPLAVQIRNIKQHRIPALFVKLNTNVVVHGTSLYKQAENETLSYRKVQAGGITCLSPIKSFCAQLFGIDISEVNFVYDLLRLLDEDGHIASIYHYNMEPYLKFDAYHLRKYSMQDIYENINALNTNKTLQLV